MGNSLLQGSAVVTSFIGHYAIRVYRVSASRLAFLARVKSVISSQTYCCYVCPGFIVGAVYAVRGVFIAVPSTVKREALSAG